MRKENRHPAADAVGQMQALLQEIRACRICEAHLALGPNPVLSAHPEARVMIVGQAPGTRVHRSGIPWNDPSGDRLREWLGVDKEPFYDPRRFAIVPMGFCYPGKGKSGDLPPRRECAPQWHPPLLSLMPGLELVLLVGQYAQQHYLENRRESLTATVQAWQDYLPDYLPLPHPSPRNIAWFKNNPWFGAAVLPYLRERIAEVAR